MNNLSNLHLNVKCRKSKVESPLMANKPIDLKLTFDLRPATFDFFYSI